MDAKQAIELLNKVSFVSGGGLRELAALIEGQDKEITDLQQRLREFDEKIQTQAMVLDARDKIIVRQGQEAVRMQRMIDKAVGMLAETEDVRLDADGMRRWLEQEAGE